MKQVYQMQGYTLHLIPTKKFKTITMSLRLQNHLTRQDTTLRALLTFVLIAATKKHPSTQALASYLDECYGAGVSTNVASKGKSQIINIYSQFVNEDYLPVKNGKMYSNVNWTKVSCKIKCGDFINYSANREEIFFSVEVDEFKSYLKDYLKFELGILNQSLPRHNA